MPDEVQKSQFIRVLDVALVGPIVLVAATRVRNENLALSLFLIGLGTIVYNGVNYYANFYNLEGTRP